MQTENDWDVYVSEGAFLEVTRGPHLTVAQAYGEDWNGAPMVNVHSQCMGPIGQVQPSTAAYRPKTTSPATPGPQRGFWTVAAVLFVLASWFAIAVSR